MLTPGSVSCGSLLFVPEGKRSMPSPLLEKMELCRMASLMPDPTNTPAPLLKAAVTKPLIWSAELGTAW